MAFDYGKRLPDGQFENHPHLPEPDRAPEKRVLPLRYWYVHKFGRACNKVTQAPKQVAETYACNPGFYQRVFCIECGGYYDLKEFVWWDDGANLDLREQNRENDKK